MQSTEILQNSKNNYKLFLILFLRCFDFENSNQSVWNDQQNKYSKLQKSSLISLLPW